MTQLSREVRVLSVASMPKKLAFVKSRSSGGAMKFKGYAARTNSMSGDLGGFREVLARGAFDAVLARGADVVLNLNHDNGQLLARTSSGTLRLSSDDRGLRFEADAPDTQLARDTATLMRRGDLTGASFAFTVAPKNESWSADETGPVRTIREVNDLFDVSIVTSPAYPEASVGLRSLKAWQNARALLVPAEGDGAEPAPPEAEGEPAEYASGMTISIDYDGTFAAAPGLWLSFIQEACAGGCEVIVISRRDDTPENRAEVEAALGEDSDVKAVILCGPASSKRDAAEAADFTVDVWIDDTPATVDSVPAERSAVRIGTQLAAARALGALARRRLLDVCGG
jgi:HK97 family phage prohead protease